MERLNNKIYITNEVRGFIVALHHNEKTHKEI